MSAASAANDRHDRDPRAHLGRRALALGATATAAGLALPGTAQAAAFGYTDDGTNWALRTLNRMRRRSGVATPGCDSAPA